MILVSNPGTHPEMMRIAGGLISAGHIVRYITSSSWAEDSMIQKLASLPLISGTPIGVNLRRRKLPSELRHSHVVGISRRHELLVQLALRSGRPNAVGLIQKRNSSFQQGLKRYMRKQGDVNVVIAQYTAAADTFKQTSRSVAKILNYPIAHHRWLMEEMQKEARLNPEWSGLLQGHDFTGEQLQSLDDEVELADTILVPSSFAARTFIESGVPASKLCVIPLGCATVEPLARPTSQRRSTRPDFQILFAGQATQRKGIGYLIEAVEQLPYTKLTILGPATPTARSLIGNRERVQLRPSVARVELYRLMNEADLLVLPSLAEGFGLVALEAMANGTPCLLSDRTFGPDLIVHGENGFLLEQVTTGSITEALIRIADSKESLPEVGIKAAATANHYSWNRYALTVARKIEELCGIVPPK